MCKFEIVLIFQYCFTIIISIGLRTLGCLQEVQQKMTFSLFFFFLCLEKQTSTSEQTFGDLLTHLHLFYCIFHSIRIIK